MQVLEDRLPETLLRVFCSGTNLREGVCLHWLRELPRKRKEDKISTGDGKLQKTGFI